MPPFANCALETGRHRLENHKGGSKMVLKLWLSVILEMKGKGSRERCCW